MQAQGMYAAGRKSRARYRDAAFECRFANGQKDSRILPVERYRFFDVASSVNV